MASVPYQLTEGAARRILNNDSGFNPVMQVVDIRKIVTGTSGDRFRLVLSDGQEFLQGMLATQNHALATSGALKKWHIIRLNDFVCNTISARRVCIVVNCDLLYDCGKAVGNAKPVSAETALAQSGGSSSSRDARGSGMSSSHQQRPPPPPPGSYQVQGGGRGPRQYTGASGGGVYQPVASLNPYQNNWRIKVRVTAKDPIRYYKNARGEGKVASINLLDDQGDEIRATLFNEGVDALYDSLHKDCVYFISRGRVGVANKRFTHIKNDYSITLNRDSEVVEAADDEKIKMQKFKFVRLSALREIAEQEFVDVIGVVSVVQPLSSVRSTKTGVDIPKREITIVDSSAACQVTLWSEMAEKYDELQLLNKVVAIKGCRVSDYGGKSLSAGPTLMIGAVMDEAVSLHQWAERCQYDFSKIATVTDRSGGGGNSQRVHFRDAQDRNLGGGEDAEYFSVVATITAISHSVDRPPWYKAAPDPDTKGKVVEDGHGKWFCAKNNKLYNTYEPRWLLRFCATDWSGQSWCACFNDEADIILGYKAVDVEAFLNSGEQDKFEAVFNAACFKEWVFRIRAKMDVYQDERRVRYQVVGVKPFDVEGQCAYLDKQIQQISELRIVN